MPASERDSKLIVTARGQHNLEPAGICRNVPDGGSNGGGQGRTNRRFSYGLIPATEGRIRPLGDRVGALAGGRAPINQIPIP